MDALVFPNEEALSTAMLARLVPDAALPQPVLFGRRPDGAVEVVPSSPLELHAQRRLVLAGVVVAPPAARLEPASCWAAAVRPRPAPVGDGALPLALFQLDAPQALLGLASELLRLGCDRHELALAGSGAFLRARTPPFYVVDGARDGSERARVYVPTPPSQDAIWTELGHSHPLAGRLAPPAEGLVLIRGDGQWTLASPGPWHSIESLLDPLLGPALPLPAPDAAPPRLQVRLRLEPASRGEAASLWVLGEGGRDAVESLARSVPAPQLEALTFCIAGDTVLLRARPGRESQVPEVPGQPYARVGQLPNLLAPAGTLLAPPLPRELLRRHFAADADLLTWLEPSPQGLARRQVREAAFRPLAEWVDYVIDASAPELEAWVRSARFELSQYVQVRAVAEPPDKVFLDPDAPAPAPEPPRRVRPAPEPQPARAYGAPLPPAASPRPSPAEPLALPPPRTFDEAERRAADLEAAFLALEVPHDHPERRAALISLARAYAAAARPSDSGLCYAHALWEELDARAAAALAREWAAAAGSHAEALLALEAPTVEQTRALAAHVLAAALEKVAPPAAPARLVAWLDRHEENLDVRTLWLARAALARLSGGDTLMLARTRDQVLQRLQRGVSLSRDVPQFLRVAGPGGGADLERTAQVTQQLEALLRAFDETQRKKAPGEAPWKLTRAYVQLEFAWGLARMGATARAQALRDQAAAALPADPVHDYLSLAYRARIGQALEGRPPETPLPREVTAVYQGMKEAGLEGMQRFKADRLRQASAVLEPLSGKADAYSTWAVRRLYRGGDERETLRSQSDSRELVRLLGERAADVGDPKVDKDERARTLEAMVDALPSLAASVAVPLLQQYVGLADRLPPEVRTGSLEVALKVAGHFGQDGLVRQLVASLGSLLRELPPNQLAELGPALASGARSLRRLGLRDAARELLTRAAGLIKGADTLATVAKLNLAGGFAGLGDVATAVPIIDAVLDKLSTESGLKPEHKDRWALSRAAATALGESPVQIALPGLARLASQLPFITDTASTSTHYCISLVSLADTLVMGHVGEALSLHASTRRFLEEDEDRVRRRVHREAQAGL